MGSEGSPEPIDFDFFAEDDDDFERSERNSRRRESPIVTTKSRPESAGSVRSDSVRSAVSSRSSISVKIPSAGPTETQGKYSDFSEEEYSHSHRENEYRSRHPVQTNLNSKKNNDDDNDRVSSDDGGNSQTRTSSSRPKTSKPRLGRRRQDSSSSHGSGSSKSNQRHSGSFSSKSDEHSDSYTSVSDSDSDVTDVSPLASPARSPTPTLEYNQDEFEDSFGKGGGRHLQAKPQPSRDGRRHQSSSSKKESVRFAGIAPSNGPAAQRDKHMDETEARELSRLLRAVLELDETPNRSQLHSFHHATKQRPLSAKTSSSGAGAQHMPHQRVNLSFSNDKVRQIDRENQRLLQKILRRPKSGAAPVTRGRETPPKLVSHSAICRQREQRKIEMENMKILGRIESVQASSTVERNQLLQDHTKQMRYASQVSKGSMRPQSSRTSDYAHSSSLGKGSSTASLNSVGSRSSSGSTHSRRMRPSSGRSMPPPPPPGGPRQAWDDRW